MDRLTARTHDGHAYLANGKDHEQEVECRSRNTAQCIMDSWERLAAYEDTGLEPEEIKQMCALARLNSNIFDNDFGNHIAELIVAEQDGRCVVLPCKTGDICYEIDPGHHGIIKHTVIGTTVYNRQADGKRYMTDFVNVITIDTQAVAEDGCEWADQYTAEEWADAPKTRTEAEAALKDAHKPGGEQE